MKVYARNKDLRFGGGMGFPDSIEFKNYASDQDPELVARLCLEYPHLFRTQKWDEADLLDDEIEAETRRAEEISAAGEGREVGEPIPTPADLTPLPDPATVAKEASAAADAQGVGEDFHPQ